MYVVEIGMRSVGASLESITEYLDVVVVFSTSAFPAEWEKYFDYLDSPTFDIIVLPWTMKASDTHIWVVVPIEYTKAIGEGENPYGHAAPSLAIAGQCRSIGLASPALGVTEPSSR